MYLLDVVGAQYVNSIQSNPDFECIVNDHYPVCCEDQLVQCFYPPDFEDSLPVKDDEIVRVLEWKGDNIFAFDAKAAAEWVDGDFSHNYLVSSDICQSIVGCGVKKWRLFEALEDGLADNLHQLKIPDYFINQISHHSNSSMLWAESY